MKRWLHGVLMAFSLALVGATPAAAALYTTSYGTLQTNSSDCDDCFDGPVAFPGTAQSINFFGTTYGSLFVGSNGYVTFGAGATSYTSSPLNTQAIAPMIAGEYTDLDSRNDASSNVYVNNSTPGQLIITWENMGHYNQNYSVRSTFQLVVRSDQFGPIPSGEGQIGFFFSTITDGATASAGFGDGLAAVNPGEVSIYSGPASSFSNHAPLWFTLSGGVPVTPGATPVPALSEWGMILLAGGMGMLGLAILRRRARM
jgi:IPTL-CTERM motif